MAFLGMRYREDYWFVGGLVATVLAGAAAGATLALPFLAVAMLLLGVVWFLALINVVQSRAPGVIGVWLAVAIPLLIVATGLAVVVSVWGFVRP